MKCISVEEFTNNLRAAVCRNNCHSTTGCKNCDQGLSIVKIIEMVEDQAVSDTDFLLNANKYFK